MSNKKARFWFRKFEGRAFFSLGLFVPFGPANCFLCATFQETFEHLNRCSLQTPEAV